MNRKTIPKILTLVVLSISLFFIFFTATSYAGDENTLYETLLATQYNTVPDVVKASYNNGLKSSKCATSAMCVATKYFHKSCKRICRKRVISQAYIGGQYGSGSCYVTSSTGSCKVKGSRSTKGTCCVCGQ